MKRRELIGVHLAEPDLPEDRPFTPRAITPREHAELDARATIRGLDFGNGIEIGDRIGNDVPPRIISRSKPRVFGKFSK